MVISIEIIFWTSLLLLVSIFFLYPLILNGIKNFYKARVLKKEIYPSVSIIIAAYNEEEVIAKKIENSFSINYPIESLEVIVVSDGSFDGTNEIVQKFRDKEGFKGIILKENKGKTTAINTAVSEAKGEIILFTDANVWLDEDALKHLVVNFNDEEIGCVCGQLNYYNPSDSETANTGGLYWHYEEAIKKLESLTGSTMGADGSIFAIRKHLFRKLEPYLIDDFSTSMGVLFQGYRIIFEDNAKAFEKHTTDLNDEIRRRRRIANRVYTAISYFKNELLSLSPLNKFKFFMHKFGRYWAGLFMFIAFISNSVLLWEANFYLYIFILQVVFYCLTFIGLLLSKFEIQCKPFYIPYYFFIMNYMQLLGVMDSIKGKRQVTWNTKNSSRS